MVYSVLIFFGRRDKNFCQKYCNFRFLLYLCSVVRARKGFYRPTKRQVFPAFFISSRDR